MEEGTRVVRAGLPEPRPGAPFLPGPTLAAPYHEPEDAEFDYGRYANPTWTRWEAALGELEGGEVLAFASGMAAAAAVLLPLLRPGELLVAPADGYPLVRALASGHLAERGVETRLVPTREAATPEAVRGARLVWVETPSNPRLDVCDLELVADLAHAEGALVCVDNTVATPLDQRPLALGADLSMASASKALSGHADLILGHVAARDSELLEPARQWRRTTGAVPGPFETWLAHRSLATLDVRLARQCENAMRIAELLAARDDVAEVRYPGLPGDPSHRVGARQMRRFGPVVSFDLGERERAEAVLGRAELVADATSFGGVHTSAERRARWGHGDAVGEGFVRLSAGVEATADLLADLERALDPA